MCFPRVGCKGNNFDFEQAGRDLLVSGNGTPTTYGLLFEDKDTPHREVYDGTTFPYYEHLGGVIAVAQLQYGLKTEYLYLPEDALAITKAAWQLGAPTPNVCKAALTDFMIEDPVWMRHLENTLRDEGIGATNELAAVFPKSSEGLEKLAAVVEYANISDSNDILRLATHLDDFVFIKCAETNEDVGRHFVDFSSEYSASPEVMDYIDFNALGNQISEDREGQFLDDGFVCMDSGCSLEQILDPDNDFTMGGI